MRWRRSSEYSCPRVRPSSLAASDLLLRACVSAVRKGDRTVADDGSLSTLPLGSEEVRIGRMGGQPETGITQMSSDRPRRRVKAIRVPSGDHTARASSPVAMPSVSARSSVPSAFTT